MHKEFLPKSLEGKLAHAVEEAAEFIVAVGKAQRFGLDSVNPLIPEAERVTNKDYILNELFDLRSALIEIEAEISGR